MDITSTLHSPKPFRHQRTASHTRSFSAAGLLSILSPTSLVSSISSPNPSSISGRWRTSSSSLGGSLTSTSPAPGSIGGSVSSPNVLGLDVPSSGDGEVDPEEPLPTFEVQPAMLAVDLSLAPGESRSCEFSHSFYLFSSWRV